MDKVTQEQMELWTGACADTEEAASVLKDIQNRCGSTPDLAHLLGKVGAELDAHLDIMKKVQIDNGLTAEQVEVLANMRADAAKFLGLLKGFFKKD